MSVIATIDFDKKLAKMQASAIWQFEKHKGDERALQVILERFKSRKAAIIELFPDEPDEYERFCKIARKTESSIREIYLQC